LLGGTGRGREAARLYGAAAAFLEGVDLRFDALVTGRDFLERHLSQARSWLGDQAWEAAWSEGREMGLERAVAYALEGEAAGPH
jgi:hypothetical protein